MGESRTPEVNDLAARTNGHPSTAWWRSAAIIGIALALAIASVDLLWLLAEPLMLLLVAIVIAQALAPIVGWLERWLSRTVGVVLVYLVLVLGFGGIGWLVFPSLVSQTQMLVNNAPDLLEQASSWFDDMGSGSTDQVITAVESTLQRFSDLLLSVPLLVFSSVIDFILIIFMSIYWLIYAPALSSFTHSLFPEERRPQVASVMGEMGHTMGGYVRGTVIDAMIIGLLTYVGLTVIGMEYVLVLAMLSGLGEFLPIVGPIIAAIPAILIALTQSPQQAGLVILFFILLQQLESNLLVPLIMRQQADVPPLLSLVAILAGSALGGLLGAIIAIPLAGALRIMVMRVAAPAERSWTGVDDALTEVGGKSQE